MVSFCLVDNAVNRYSEGIISRTRAHIKSCIRFHDLRTAQAIHRYEHVMSDPLVYPLREFQTVYSCRSCSLIESSSTRCACDQASSERLQARHARATLLGPA
jgi:hypothetical protein